MWTQLWFIAMYVLCHFLIIRTACTPSAQASLTNFFNCHILQIMDTSKASRISNAQGRLLMTPSDSNFEIAATPESGIDIVEPKRSNRIGAPFRKVRNFFGGLMVRDSDPKLLSPPVSIRDMQRYEPKGFVGMTMRVLRRRFFNLWSRSPSSWTDAISQADAALPGTFASRKSSRIPMATTSERNPSEDRSRMRRLRESFQSTLFTVALPVRIVRGRLGLGGTGRNSRASNLDEIYSMQVSQSEQLGIFGQNARRREDVEGKLNLGLIIVRENSEFGGFPEESMDNFK
jgi:hypothetical protein